MFFKLLRSLISNDNDDFMLYIIWKLLKNKPSINLKTNLRIKLKAKTTFLLFFNSFNTIEKIILIMLLLVGRKLDITLFELLPRAQICNVELLLNKPSLVS